MVARRVKTSWGGRRDIEEGGRGVRFLGQVKINRKEGQNLGRKRKPNPLLWGAGR